MATLHGIEYIMQDGEHVSASDFRDKGRSPEEATGMCISFDCPICGDEQEVRTPTPLSENETHICTETCGEFYYLYPMTAIDQNDSTVTMSIEKLVETQLRSVSEYHEIDRYVGTAGVDMLEELKVAVLGTAAVFLGILGAALLGVQADLNTLSPVSISFILVASSAGLGAAAVVTGAIGPLVRGYVAYREIEEEVDYSFDTFIRHAANYHHRRPY